MRRRGASLTWSSLPDRRRHHNTVRMLPIGDATPTPFELRSSQPHLLEVPSKRSQTSVLLAHRLVYDHRCVLHKREATSSREGPPPAAAESGKPGAGCVVMHRARVPLRRGGRRHRPRRHPPSPPGRLRHLSELHISNTRSSLKPHSRPWRHPLSPPGRLQHLSELHIGKHTFVIHITPP